MHVQVVQDGSIGLRGINPFLFDLLREIVRCGASGDPRVEARFYPPPVEEGDLSDLREDWKSLVQPELQAAFQQARDVVQADLRNATETEDGCAFQIAPHHADAWMSALNQARLALAGENHFTEADLSADVPSAVGGPTERALLQMHFYAFLQDWLVQMAD